jgi:hypothetical protein
MKRQNDLRDFIEMCFCFQLDRIRAGKAKYAGEVSAPQGLRWWRAYAEDFKFNGERAATLESVKKSGVGEYRRLEGCLLRSLSND